MRTSISAAVALGGSLALAALVVPTAATAAPARGGTCFDLGVAGKYGEFVEGDDTHKPDAEGAVAVGGNADFSRGFTIGNELTPEEIAALPGGYSLVVGGNLNIGGGAHFRLMKGKGVYAGTLVGGGRADNVEQGASPIDFAKEFANLRHVSTELAKTTGGAPVVDGKKITFTGTDATTNVFTVAADVLQKAGDVYLKVPAGSTTIINVTGASYDQTKAPTTGFWIWDHAKGAYVQDDKTQSADGGAERAELLWNLPTATSVTKHSGNAWPGGVLAPNAAFDLGTGGPVNGSVWAKSLTGSGGAETHHYPFAGCLPGGTATTPPSGSPSPSGATGPSESPKPSESATTPGGASATPGASESPQPSGSGSAAPTPSPSASRTGSTGGGSNSGGGGLAFTGAEGITALTVGGAAVLAAGGGILYAVRRKKAGSGA
ncbi:choice-of-anchor A family protein [Kitasatospora cineracea]|uniref:LPXTG-motif cell wall-anchored protein/choice-of-anchor A domain-containing protein n=1 Tax=Kitasatospora cineracea TaxID=88074 RepID=A0A3N4RMU4_9ACTN|nr:choice-of-anchor A family protein [Kitasatospora cineracea]RPE32131.1 LPXTG-motif cell wall-anchored protein/choice-of-anchor A domain-containing protein [Kitasatospora cineracea]